MSSDNIAYRFPVSVKGIFLYENKIPLLKNERDEFELPGGKLDLFEKPEECVIREIKEELNLDTKVEKIIDSWLYSISSEVNVVIITYGCKLLKKEEIKISNEHKQLILVDPYEIDLLKMPSGYKDSIKTWLKNSVVK